jgi:hypothetical protein
MNALQAQGTVDRIIGSSVQPRTLTPDGTKMAVTSDLVSLILSKPAKTLEMGCQNNLSGRIVQLVWQVQRKNGVF